MTDITDDIAEEISFQNFEDDCRLLQSLLNDVLQRELGPKFMEKVERTRCLAQVCFISLHFRDRSVSVSCFLFTHCYFFNIARAGGLDHCF